MNDPTTLTKGFVLDEIGLTRNRPQPWQSKRQEFNGQPAVVGTVSVSSLSTYSSIPTPSSLSIPTNQIEFNAVIAQVYSDMNIAITDLNSAIAQINASLSSLTSQINTILS